VFGVCCLKNCSIDCGSCGNCSPGKYLGGPGGRQRPSRNVPQREAAYVLGDEVLHVTVVAVEFLSIFLPDHLTGEKEAAHATQRNWRLVADRPVSLDVIVSPPLRYE
jgi:hypothetical protein